MGNNINSEAVIALRANMDIKTIVTLYGVQLKNYGSDCPFCKAKDTFAVSETKGIWQCVRCLAGGDIFAFVMNIENLNFADACEKIKEFIAKRITKMYYVLKAATFQPHLFAQEVREIREDASSLLGMEDLTLLEFIDKLELFQGSFVGAK